MRQSTPIRRRRRLPNLQALLRALSLVLVLVTWPAPAIGDVRLHFEDVDLQTLITEVAHLTGTTFLFDPAHVKGRVTVLAGDVTSAQALELLRSALALHRYALVARPEGVWILRSEEATRSDFVVRIVRLVYANAGEVAFTLSRVVPPGVRVAPFFATNSVLISGNAAAVERMLDAIRN